LSLIYLFIESRRIFLKLPFKNRGGKGSYEIDMTTGPLLGKICKFAIPLALSSILQLLFNAADIIVVGNFVGSTALAAVGSTGALINLIVNVFIGLSVGTNVLVARYYGSGQRKDLEETVHTSITVSLVGGAILIVIGIILAEPLLLLMGTPADVIDQATLYMRIFFVGMPVNMLYNFGAAVLRSVGDTKRPLYYLVIAGIVNVILNLFFVIVCHLDVAGVAIATVISQAISAALVLICLVRSNGPYSVNLKKLRIKKDKLIGMARIGLPAGFQGAIFSISNVLIQSSINSFGSTVMAGSTAAANIEGFVYVAMNAFHQAALSFTSQNIGAGKFERVNKILASCVFLVSVVGIVLGVGAYLLGTPLLGIYSSDPQVISYGLERMFLVCMPYFLCGIMDVMVGSLRGMGYSVVPMIVSIVGACGLRVLWIYTIFAVNRTLFVLFLSYPVSWAITAACHLLCYFVLYHKVISPKLKERKEAKKQAA
jgi:putative MATE family efflux protein